MPVILAFSFLNTLFFSLARLLDGSLAGPFLSSPFYIVHPFNSTLFPRFFVQMDICKRLDGHRNINATEHELNVYYAPCALCTHIALSFKMHAPIQGYTYQLFTTIHWISRVNTFKLGASFRFIFFLKLFYLFFIPLPTIVCVVVSIKKLVAIYVYDFATHFMLGSGHCPMKRKCPPFRAPRNWMGVKSKVCHYAL